MASELSFKNLPFVPDSRQVIYVESTYHKKLNRFIRDHYQWLRKTFSRFGYEFCYLPMLSKEVISYNAPYLTEEECNAMIGDIPSLNKYAIDGESIAPSLVFSLDIPVEDAEGNTVLQLVAIETKWYGPTKLTFTRLAKEIKHVARVQFRHYREIEEKKNRKEPPKPKITKVSSDSGIRFRIDEPDDADNESLEVTDSSDSGIRFRIDEPDDADNESSKVTDSSDSGIRFRIDEPDDADNESSKVKDSSDSGVRFSIDEPDDAEQEFDNESSVLIDKYKMLVRALRNKGINTWLLHKIIDKEEPLSRLRITKDYRIFLVDYNNIEIKLSVLPKAVFLLFLHHPEGIRFKELIDYYSELLQIYTALNPIGGRMRQERSIRDITDPCNNSINEKCARIREAFVGQFDDRLAQNYYVTGKRGEPKRITLDKSMIIWE